MSRRSWLVPFVLAVAIFSAHAQESQASSSLPTLELKSLESSELFALFYQTLAEQERLLTEDRQRLTAYSDYMTRLLDDLTMQILDSQNIARRAKLDLQAARLALLSSEQSVASLKDAAKSALSAASWWRAGTFVAGGAAVALAGLCIALAGK